MKQLLKSLPTGFLSVIAIIVVVYLSLTPDPLGQVDFFPFAGADKVAHFLLYFFATVLFLTDYAKYKSPHHTKLNQELMFTCSAMLLGLLMEIGQLALSNGREYDSADIIANCLGAAIAFCYMHWRGISSVRHLLQEKHRHHRHHHKA